MSLNLCILKFPIMLRKRNCVVLKFQSNFVRIRRYKKDKSLMVDNMDYTTVLLKYTNVRSKLLRKACTLVIGLSEKKHKLTKYTLVLKCMTQKKSIPLGRTILVGKLSHTQKKRFPRIK